MLNIKFSKHTLSDNQVEVIFIDERLKLDNATMMFDQQHHGLISKTIQDARGFSGKAGQSKILTTTNKAGAVKHLIILGIGDESKLKASCLEELGGKVLSLANSTKAVSIGIMLTGKIGDFQCEVAAALLSSGILLASYQFDSYFTKKKDEDKNSINSVEILVDDIAVAEKLFIEKKAIATGVFSARNYISEPPNILYPASYAEMIQNELEPLGIKVEIYGEREMRNFGMGALLGVGQGSQNESKLVVMQYFGESDHNIAPIALVGKGVTFDSGGISIKPAAGMGDMKYDMAGSAAVVGTIKALVLRKAKVNVVGVIGLVENMPSGNAQRPSDIVKTMSGQTAEVLNTDAEGRLVLADAIWYTQDRFKPKCVIDLATLTGAIVVALGNVYAGCFANNEELASQLIKAGDQVNEKLWRMPLHKDYDKMLKSDIADMANISGGNGAGSSTAAHFIGRFVNESTAWAHLDIAGVAWEKNGKAICPKGAVGYGVRLLNQFIQDNYEV
ncbi:Leucyl aminopeptidase [Candidatus Trichorickettsia mobilis]|uniref:Probable cytosol aminopeptidase n=1 Tax=Candidatus Trichorickettsia mobilis TaxID=1346319 RepID=A0ABZ0USW4_9RICK|nr:leucyl aminopeptidase [Candidatus Trichorickettsia mobilis]WPY00611.1 Leucyl aminopeptidase [Candidatus Trichorickettsia mobilis]